MSRWTTALALPVPGVIAVNTAFRGKLIGGRRTADYGFAGRDGVGGQTVG